jgi:hypothetical protein
MTDAPERIWFSAVDGITVHNPIGVAYDHPGKDWHGPMPEYRRADAPPTLAEAMKVVLQWPGLKAAIEKGMTGHRQGAFREEYVNGVVLELCAALANLKGPTP